MQTGHMGWLKWCRALRAMFLHPHACTPARPAKNDIFERRAFFIFPQTYVRPRARTPFCGIFTHTHTHPYCGIMNPSNCGASHPPPAGGIHIRIFYPPPSQWFRLPAAPRRTTPLLLRPPHRPASPAPPRRRLRGESRLVIKERDDVLAENVLKACRAHPGRPVVAVLGLLHCNGVANILRNSDGFRGAVEGAGGE